MKRTILIDVTAGVGVGLIGKGLYIIHPSLAYIGFGVLLLVIAGKSLEMLNQSKVAAEDNDAE